MKKSLVIGLAVSILFSFCIYMPAIGADIKVNSWGLTLIWPKLWQNRWA